jgi:uncharacterized protein (DUF952 family)
MSLIYHVVSAADWAKQEDQADYQAASLETEGFIHLSEKEQVAGVLERYYQSVPDLLLLHVDPSRLTHKLKYELSTNNERFPHLYGPLNKEAVVEVKHLT